MKVILECNDPNREEAVLGRLRYLVEKYEEFTIEEVDYER